MLSLFLRDRVHERQPRRAHDRRDDTLPDLLVSDISMPGEMSGSDLAIEARYLRPGIKILMTSGYADPDSLEATRAIAEAGFLRKPYKEGELAQTIRRLLGTVKPRLSRALARIRVLLPDEEGEL